MEKELRRNEEERMIGGVCAGLGDYLGIDKTWVRLFFMLSVFFSFFGIGILGPFLYALLWAIVPRKTSYFSPFSSETYRTTKKGEGREGNSFINKNRDRIGAGMLLIGIGAFLLVIQLGIISWWHLIRFWPLTLVLAGAYVISSSFYRKPSKTEKRPLSADLDKDSDINIENNRE